MNYGQLNPKPRLYLCRHPGCTALIPREEQGYCKRHKKPSFREQLDGNKAPGMSVFYGSYKWKKTRKAFARAHPLCAACKRKGIVKEGELTHHVIEVPELLDRGLNPCDFKYLERLCHSCHNSELRKRIR